MIAQVKLQQRLPRCPCLFCYSPVSLARITRHRATLLTLITDYRTNADIASALQITVASVKREVEDLRDLTDSHSKRELARWWVQHRPQWQELIAQS